MPTRRFRHRVGMDPEIRTWLDAHGGVASSGRMAEAGISAAAVSQAVRSGEVLRLRRDVLVEAAVWAEAQMWDRHQIRARAVMHSRHDDAGLALSHHSALALWDVPLYAVDNRVHLTRTDGRRGHSGGLLRVHAPIDAGWTTQHRDLTVVKPARAALQVAATFGIQAGLVSADGCLRLELCTREDLSTALAAKGYGHGTARVRTTVEHAHGASESAGESRSRWVFVLAGLPTPELQAVITDRGQFVGRVDFLFREQRTIVEFDGLGKYDRREDLVREKQREDWLRSLGYTVVRLTWAELANPAGVRAKVFAAFALAEGQRAS